MSLRSRFRLVTAAATLVVAASSCGPGYVNSENRAILSLAGANPVVVPPGGAIDLAWLLVRQSSGPLEGEEIELRIIGAGDHGCTLSDQATVTDEAGLAIVRLTAGDNPIARTVQVEGSVTSLPSGDLVPPAVAFTVNIEEPVRALRRVPPERDRYEGLTRGRVSLAVRATTGGARPLPDETIIWEVTDDGGGDARFVLGESDTDMTGVARADLACGGTASTVTVLATMEGTAPVDFTVDIREWGTCDTDHPCPSGWECVDGACIEPRPDCTSDDECAGDLRCRFGECVDVTAGEDGEPCKTDDECGPGETCVYGECTPCEERECPCETVDDCPDGFVCFEGVCVCPEGSPDCGGDPTDCETVDPDLAGLWDIDSELYLGEALPSWLGDALGTLGPPFRFLAEGMAGGFDFDIPIIGDALEDAADSLVDSYVPPWVGELLGAIGALSDIFSTLHVLMDLNLWGAGMPDQYLGELTWTEIELVWEGDVIRGRIEDITGLTVDHDSIEAEAICGTFYIHRHDVSIGFGYIVRWVLDVIVTAVTEGEYFSLEALLLDLTSVCADLARAVDDLADDLSDGLDISLPDVYDVTFRACEAGIVSGTASAIDWLEGLMVSGDAMSLGGHATISGPDNLDDGRWDGALMGRDFWGEWTATRR